MPRPVLIDLYFTLIEPDPEHSGLETSAQLLEISPQSFQAASIRSFDARMIGTLRTPEEVIDLVLQELDRTVSADVYTQLVAQRWGFFHGLRLYPDVWDTLTTLKERGHQLGLVTNCSAETTLVLERLQLEPFFDVLALSCEIGAAKPDPRIYQHALDQLGVDPSTVVYVGDGDTDEHAGAARFGMTTVLLQRPHSPQRTVQADYTISSLTALPDLPIVQG